MLLALAVCARAAPSCLGEESCRETETKGGEKAGEDIGNVAGGRGRRKKNPDADTEDFINSRGKAAHAEDGVIVKKEETQDTEDLDFIYPQGKIADAEPANDAYYGNYG